MVGRIYHVGLTVSDLDRSIAFYRDILGLAFQKIDTLGKYYEEDGKILLPLAVQVHHAVCDGFHICRFVNELQELING